VGEQIDGVSFLVEYKPDASNTVADTLSRREEGEAGELVALSVPNFKVFDELRADTEEVAELYQLKVEIIAGVMATNGRWSTDS
jgi:hypothetical protein